MLPQFETTEKRAKIKKKEMILHLKESNKELHKELFQRNINSFEIIISNNYLLANH